MAIAASYHLTKGVDPTRGAVDLVVGYHQIEPLRQDELSILFDLVLMRLIFRIVITEWRVSLFPADRQDIMRNSLDTWAYLSRLQEVSRTAVDADLLRRCSVTQV